MSALTMCGRERGDRAGRSSGDGGIGGGDVRGGRAARFGRGATVLLSRMGWAGWAGWAGWTSWAGVGVTHFVDSHDGRHVLDWDHDLAGSSSRISDLSPHSLRSAGSDSSGSAGSFGSAHSSGFAGFAGSASSGRTAALSEPTTRSARLSDPLTTLPTYLTFPERSRTDALSAVPSLAVPAIPAASVASIALPPAHSLLPRPPRPISRFVAEVARLWPVVRGWDKTTKLLVGSAVGLIPWIVVLGLTLPTHTVARNWSTVWIGFDLLLAVAFGVTARLYLRNDPRIGIMAAVVATLLIVDCWFDTSTASGGLDAVESWASALFVEIPIAVFCARLAWRSSLAMVRVPSASTSAPVPVPVSPPAPVSVSAADAIPTDPSE